MKYQRLKLHQKLDYPSHTYTTEHFNTDVKTLFDRVAAAGKYRSSNYNSHNEIANNTLACSVTIVDDKPVLASLAWKRPLYNGIIRLCTRYCIDPEYTMLNFGKGTDGMRLDTMDHIIQQLELCQALGYTDFFIGREDWKSRGRRTRKIAKVLSNHTGIEWNTSDGEVLCAPKMENDQCWQYIIYNNRKDFDYESEL